MDTAETLKDQQTQYKAIDAMFATNIYDLRKTRDRQVGELTAAICQGPRESAEVTERELAVPMEWTNNLLGLCIRGRHTFRRRYRLRMLEAYNPMIDMSDQPADDELRVILGEVNAACTPVGNRLIADC